MAQNGTVNENPSIRVVPVNECWLAIETVLGGKRVPALDLPAFTNKEEAITFIQTNHAIDHRQIEYSLYTLDEIRHSPYYELLLKKFRRPR
jgi:hypothetical protein